MASLEQIYNLWKAAFIKSGDFDEYLQKMIKCLFILKNIHSELNVALKHTRARKKCKIFTSCSRTPNSTMIIYNTKHMTIDLYFKFLKSLTQMTLQPRLKTVWTYFTVWQNIVTDWVVSDFEASITFKSNLSKKRQKCPWGLWKLRKLINFMASIFPVPIKATLFLIW